jgi:hypothetical protein
MPTVATTTNAATKHQATKTNAATKHQAPTTIPGSQISQDDGKGSLYGQDSFAWQPGQTSFKLSQRPQPGTQMTLYMGDNFEPINTTDWSYNSKTNSLQFNGPLHAMWQGSPQTIESGAILWVGYRPQPSPPGHSGTSSFAPATADKLSKLRGF